MSNLFYSGSGRHTSGAFTVTMKDLSLIHI